MEPSHQTGKVTRRWLWALTLSALGLAAWWQCSSPFARVLAAKADQNVYLAVLTSPVTLVQYNPSTQKALVREIPCRKCARPRAEDLGLPATAPVKFYAPRKTEREGWWDAFKQKLEAWRYRPLPPALWPYHYARALAAGKTNLNPADAVLLAMELSQLEINDFTVKITAASKRKKKPEPQAAPMVEDKAPLAVEDRPIVVEILNASGKRGLALALTQYLRDQNEKGQLRVDVLQYDNYPGGLLEETRVVDFSGRLMQVKQLSTAIGCRKEIRSEPRGNAICDTRIILGKDFELP